MPCEPCQALFVSSSGTLLKLQGPQIRRRWSLIGRLVQTSVFLGPNCSSVFRLVVSLNFKQLKGLFLGIGKFSVLLPRFFPAVVGFSIRVDSGRSSESTCSCG